MYETHWQLQCRPFDHTADQSFYYPSEAHQGALLKLRYAVEHRRGAALLAGAAGTGKTLLVEMLLRQLPEPFSPRAHVVFPQMPPAELMAYLADELGAPCDSTASGSIQHSVRRIQKMLADNSRGGHHAVVVVDEAHLLDGNAAFESLRLLSNFQTDSRPDLTLLIVGQPRLLPVLERMRQLEERIAVKCLLRSLTLEETVSYVSHRLTAAGAGRAIFDSQALEAIHQLTQGSPRQINRLCDLCLLIGYADEQRQLDASRVTAVCQELVSVAPE